MSTVCVRVSAPLASWGDGSVFRDRHTAPFPTLSALQGLMAAAAGLPRSEPWPKWLSGVSVAFRVERRGTLVSDFHTVNPVDVRRYKRLSEKDRAKLAVVRKASGAREDNPVLTRRFYVADAEYLVLVGDSEGEARAALTAPRWALYAGRKSCPLSEPFVLGVFPGSPEEALVGVPSPSGSDQLDAVTFGAPATRAVRSEVRRDRSGGFGDHRPQRRDFVRVSPPKAADWFSVIDHLSGIVAQEA